MPSASEELLVAAEAVLSDIAETFDVSDGYEISAETQKALREAIERVKREAS